VTVSAALPPTEGSAGGGEPEGETEAVGSSSSSRAAALRVAVALVVNPPACDGVDETEATTDGGPCGAREDDGVATRSNSSSEPPSSPKKEAVAEPCALDELEALADEDADADAEADAREDAVTEMLTAKERADAEGEELMKEGFAA